MAHVSKKPKQKPHLNLEEQRERDATTFAQLLLDIYKEKKHK